MQTTRTETDSLGSVTVPATAPYGAQTQRAVDNFPLSGHPMPSSFLRALLCIKRAAAISNTHLGLVPKQVGDAIVASADDLLSSTLAPGVSENDYVGIFPVDVFQTGSGTSTNMNMNEVLANLARARLGEEVHPNDHVNCCQSSNDVVPASILLAAATQSRDILLPGLNQLCNSIAARAGQLGEVVKTGRTHLMDAMPLRLDQELGAWEAQVRDGVARLEALLPQLLDLPLGGTAVGTGVNAHPQFAQGVAEELRSALNLEVTIQSGFRDLSRQDISVDYSGRLNATAASLMKICNDLRWMGSGPLSGLSELQLPALQPGSSIMPGKVNPVVPEALCMVCAQISGNHMAITIAGQSGNFQLNVMLPLIARNLLESIELLGRGAALLADKVIADFAVNEERLQQSLQRNPILVTALNQRIGYAAGSAIAKRAFAEGRPVLDVALEETALEESELRSLLDPRSLTEGGIP